MNMQTPSYMHTLREKNWKKHFKKHFISYSFNFFLKLECTPGYTGPNCTAQCPYPTYGFACQGFCNCSNDTCNMSWGCISSTTLAMGG